MLRLFAKVGVIISRSSFFGGGGPPEGTLLGKCMFHGTIVLLAVVGTLLGTPIGCQWIFHKARLLREGENLCLDDCDWEKGQTITRTYNNLEIVVAVNDWVDMIEVSAAIVVKQYLAGRDGGIEQFDFESGIFGKPSGGAHSGHMFPHQTEYQSVREILNQEIRSQKLTGAAEVFQHIKKAEKDLKSTDPHYKVDVALVKAAMDHGGQKSLEKTCLGFLPSLGNPISLEEVFLGFGYPKRLSAHLPTRAIFSVNLP